MKLQIFVQRKEVNGFNEFRRTLYMSIIILQHFISCLYPVDLLCLCAVMSECVAVVTDEIKHSRVQIWSCLWNISSCVKINNDHEVCADVTALLHYLSIGNGKPQYHIYALHNGCSSDAWCTVGTPGIGFTLHWCHFRATMVSIETPCQIVKQSAATGCSDKGNQSSAMSYLLDYMLNVKWHLFHIGSMCYTGIGNKMWPISLSQSIDDCYKLR